MRATLLIAALLAAGVSAGNARAQTVGPVDPGAQVDVSRSRSVTVNGVTGVNVRTTTGASQGYMVPDDRGGYVNYAPGPPMAQPKPSAADAEEIRLYARELASQITRGISGDTPLYGVSSMPTAFVDQDTRAATPFGRLMGEQMIYELNSRGFPVKEARGAAPVKAKGKKAAAEPLAVLAGSYYVDKDNLFVNARLVEPSGRVLRTGSVLIPMTPTLKRMLGIPDYNGLRPTPPTLIGSRDVNDPPCLGGSSYSSGKSPTPYSSTPKKRATAKKPTKKAVKQPCPPGCEPIDTAAKSGAKQPAAKTDQK